MAVPGTGDGVGAGGGLFGCVVGAAVEAVAVAAVAVVVVTDEPHGDEGRAPAEGESGATGGGDEPPTAANTDAVPSGIVGGGGEMGCPMKGFTRDVATVGGLPAPLATGSAGGVAVTTGRADGMAEAKPAAESPWTVGRDGWTGRGWDSRGGGGAGRAA